jgi:histidinol-phosphate aminotransferase
VAGVAERAAERVAAIPPYRPGRSSPGPAAGKLSSNESPLSPAPEIRAAISAAVERLNRYPEQGPVVESLAAHLGVPADQLILTNGSDELCYLIATVLLGAGRTAVLGEPCYQIDATASLLAGASLRRVALVDGGHDLSGMARASFGASVVWLPSPHNPTGVACDPDELSDFLDRVPQDCLVVLDEAYRAFSDPAVQPDVELLLARHPNLLVQRTFSKDWALAGLRVGYGLASPALIESLSRARPPFSVNILALAAVEAALEAAAATEAWRTAAVARARQERARLESALASLGVEYFPSQANFVTARLDPEQLGPALAAAGTVVRSGDDLGIPGWVRISIGWPPQMALLRSTLYSRLRKPVTTGMARKEL